MTLIEVLDNLTGTPVELVLDGQKWVAPAYEIALAGETEEWVIFNPTADSHPIHLHLVQFQVISRQPFNNPGYVAAWEALNGLPPLTAPTVSVPNWASFITGPAVAPPAGEMGWKDTVMMHPDEVTTIRIRFAPTEAPITGLGAPAAPGYNVYPFDPSVGPGYVWHCHILDHEDNEMMRPLMTMVGAQQAVEGLNTYIQGLNDTAFDKKAANIKKTLNNQLSAAIQNLNIKQYQLAIDQLNSILTKIDLTGRIWITDTTAQTEILTQITAIIAHINMLMLI